jgi:O-succinylbenzoic acid--CoA ligase
MVNKSPRKLIEVPPSWSIPEQLQALRAAVMDEGPALSFGPTKFDSVASQIAVVIPTSGSTGSVKEVALSAGALMTNAKASLQFLEADLGDTWSLLLPTHHIAGVNVLARAIALGSELSATTFDFASIVPTQLFRALNGDQLLLEALLGAKAVLVGGAATDPELLAQARALGINVVTSYGMSEMSGGCVYNGYPLQGVEVEIRDDARIALRGAMRAEGYLGVDESLVDGDGWFLTSDIGEVSAGRLFVHGRIDDQIISGGEKISLSAIDDFLNAGGERIYMSCAIAHPEWGEQLCLASSKTLDQAAITQALRERFGRHATAKLFLEEIELPTTSIGKADRRALAQKFERINP